MKQKLTVKQVWKDVRLFISIILFGVYWIVRYSMGDMNLLDVYIIGFWALYLSTTLYGWYDGTDYRSEYIGGNKKHNTSPQN